MLLANNAKLQNWVCTLTTVYVVACHGLPYNLTTAQGRATIVYPVWAYLILIIFVSEHVLYVTSYATYLPRTCATNIFLVNGTLIIMLLVFQKKDRLSLPTRYPIYNRKHQSSVDHRLVIYYIIHLCTILPFAR